MLLDERRLIETESRLDFEPQQMRESLAKRPLDNETPERQQKRLAQVVSAAGGPAAAGLDLERVINGNDLLNINYLDKGLLASAAVGRVIVVGSDGDLLGYGTGSMISPRLMLTNNHVLRDAESAHNSQLEFNYQFDLNGRQLPSEVFDLRPDEFFYTNRELDFSVVAVVESSQSGRATLSQYGALKLNREVGKVSPGESLTIIQHPGGNPKQIAVRENQLLKIEPLYVWYMTDTAPGSSGSPVFNDQWQIVALHHSGVPAKDDDGNWLTVDGKIWDATMDESRVKWIANEGVRVSCIVQDIETNCYQNPLARDFLTSIQRVPSEAVVATTSPIPSTIPSSIPSPASAPTYTGNSGAATNHNGKDRQMSEVPTNAHGSVADTRTITNAPDAAARPEAAPASAAQAIVHVSESGAVSIALPLNITVSLGALATNGHESNNGVTVAPAPAPATTPSLDEAVTIDQDYSNRKGYIETFLGTGARAVPLPQLSTTMKPKAAVNKKAAAGADKNVLPYHHYSVVMNRERRMAFYTAVNIDGRVSYRIKRETDKWFRDPRIDVSEQNGEDLYAGNDLDRGHLVRRLDPAWGNSESLAKVANDDTFHFTNCTPQHKDFNQNQQTWAGLEDYILNHADAEDFKVTVFTGPIFAGGDPDYRGYKLPRQFWKVVVMVKADGKLSATAYLLSQASLLTHLEEAFVFGAYKTYQVSVKKIEGLTGLSFGTLKSFDPKNNLEAETFDELSHPEQIVF